MRVGFDAKRAFFNNTGLGNYSRNLLQQLFQFYPQNEYLLYSPSSRIKIKFQLIQNAKIKTPDNWFAKAFKSYWRSFLITKQIKLDRLNIYHGLSNELPFGITETGTKSVVTIHDLIFKRFPQWYRTIDVKIYDSKFRYAAFYSDIIIAVSQNTAEDIQEFYKINPSKIRVIYQSCNPTFFQLLDKNIINEVLESYNLPNEYILYVGTIEERKNLHRLVEAIVMGNIDFPLVVVGRKTKYYYQIVQPIIQKHKLEHKIFLIENIDNRELPAIYQGAKLFVYPSLYEGFGIPILEAQASGVPVITSKGSCFKETGGEHSLYVNSNNSEEIAYVLQKVLNDKSLRIEMIEKGRHYAKKFSDNVSINKLYKVYEELV
jgi:glycosyltransferase involved in cell wall biosynthesis